MFGARWSDRARAFFADLDDEQREKVLTIIYYLELDPSIDGKAKIELLMPPVVLGVYIADLLFWVIYYVPDGAHVQILKIGWAWEEVN